MSTVVDVSALGVNHNCTLISNDNAKLQQPNQDTVQFLIVAASQKVAASPNFKKISIFLTKVS